MTWPTDTLTNTHTDGPTDDPSLARDEIDRTILMVKSILGEAPAGSLLLTNQDEGSGNGLDADTLDGEHATAFADAAHNHSAANITSGTLPVERGGTERTSHTAFATLHGNGVGAIAAIGPNATAGTVLMSNGAAAYPTFQALPTFPTVDVHASDFYDTEINATSGSGIFNEVVDTGFGDNNFVWGISGIRRTDGGADTITVTAVDAEGFVYGINSGAVTSAGATPSTGQIRIYFTHSSGGNIGFRVKVWARKNI